MNSSCTLVVVYARVQPTVREELPYVFVHCTVSTLVLNNNIWHDVFVLPVRSLRRSIYGDNFSSSSSIFFGRLVFPWDHIAVFLPNYR